MDRIRMNTTMTDMVVVEVTGYQIGRREVIVGVQWYVGSLVTPPLLMVMDRIRMNTTMTDMVVVEVTGYQIIPSLCFFIHCCCYCQNYEQLHK